MLRTLFGILVLGSAVFVSGAGCKVPSLELPMVLDPSSSRMDTPSDEVGWSSRGPGVDRLKISFATSTASDVVIYRFSLADHVLGFEHATSAVAVSEWLRRSPALFIANGVYFHEDQLPSGWLKIQGSVIGKRAFDRDKSALLELVPKPDIVIAPADMEKRMFYASDAAQSFPLLISQGEQAVKEESGKVARRTFVGFDQAHQFFYVGIVPYTGISLYELSQALMKLPVRWDAVLNLDGGPSSGVIFRGTDQPETIDSYVTVPNVLVIRSKTK